jgi:hypothetical protein
MGGLPCNERKEISGEKGRRLRSQRKIPLARARKLAASATPTGNSIISRGSGFAGIVLGNEENSLVNAILLIYE